jgi:fluoroquinolone transport system permease protein
MRAGGLLLADARRLRRDPMLLLLGLLPPALAVAAWAIEPRLDGWLASAGAAPAPPWTVTATVAVLLLIAPMMFGFLSGLMLLDERDEGVLEALALTPVGTRGVLAYRMAWPAAWGAAVALLTLALVGDSLGIGLVALLMLPLLAALQTPLLAFFLGAFAGNKVEGMALSKVGSMLIGAGALCVLLPWPWQALAFWSPHYWTSRLLLPDGGAAGGVLVPAAAALAAHLFALVALGRLYARRAG